MRKCKALFTIVTELKMLLLWPTAAKTLYIIITLAGQCHTLLWIFWHI